MHPTLRAHNPTISGETVSYLQTDQYTNVNRDCPMRIDMHPADNAVEITLGEHRAGGDTLRLVIDHPDTCLRLAEVLNEARDKLTAHLRAESSHIRAASQLDMPFAAAPTAS
jgi:hypothetical protein